MEVTSYVEHLMGILTDIALTVRCDFSFFPTTGEVTANTPVGTDEPQVYSAERQHLPTFYSVDKHSMW